MLAILSLLAMLSDWICFSVAPIPQTMVRHTSPRFPGGPTHTRTLACARPPLTLAPRPQEKAYEGLDAAFLVTIFLSTNVLFCFVEPYLVVRRGLRRVVVDGSWLMLLGKGCLGRARVDGAGSCF